MSSNTNDINNNVEKLHDRAIQRLPFEQNLELSSSFDVKYQAEIYKRQFREIYAQKGQILSQMQRPPIQQFESSTTYCPTSFMSLMCRKSRRYPKSLFCELVRLFSILNSKMNLLLLDKIR